MDDNTPDPRAILAVLGITGATATVPVSGGSDTTIWRVECDAGTFALRVFRASQRRTYQREVLAMGAAGKGGLPVPPIHAQGIWHDRPALLLGWCAGRSLKDELAARPWRAWQLGLAFGRTQASLHALSPPPEFALQPDAWLDWAGPATPALRERVRALSPRPPALLHLDYHPLNVMTDGQRITAVLDWANARAGDPRADVARTLTILRLSPFHGGPLRPIVMLVVRALEVGWRRGYRQVAGSLHDLAPFYAWAGAVMERDLAPKATRIGLTSDDLERMRQWTATWERRAGLRS